MSDHDDDASDINNDNAQPQQQQNIQPQIITTVSNNNAKFPYLKKDEYEVWAMKMEYWITNNDMNIWKVIQNGNSLKRTGRDRDGRVIILPPTTADEHIAVQRESKARTTLLQSIPDDHVADFHYMDDARDIWNAVKARFGGNAESKKMRKSMLKQEFSEFRISESEGLHKGYDRMQKILSQLNQLKAKPDDEDINLKFLRGLPSSWSQVALTLKTKGGLELLSFDDLYYKLKTLEIDIKGYSTHSSSQSPSHSAFVSTTSTSKKMSYAESPSFSSSTTYSAPSSSKARSHSSGNVLQDVLHSLVAESEPEQQVAYEDFEQIDKLDLEEMNIKWQMAMLSVRVNKFEKKAGRKIEFDKKEAARFNKKAVRCYKCLQKGHFARECRAKGGNEKRYSSFKIQELGKKEVDTKALITVDTLENWKEHEFGDDEGFAPKEYGMVAGCGVACEEGVAEVYSLIIGNGTDAAAREFVLMGMTFEIVYMADVSDSQLRPKMSRIESSVGLAGKLVGVIPALSCRYEKCTSSTSIGKGELSMSSAQGALSSSKGGGYGFAKKLETDVLNARRSMSSAQAALSSSKGGGYRFSKKIVDGMTLQIQTIDLILETHGGGIHLCRTKWEILLHLWGTTRYTATLASLLTIEQFELASNGRKFNITADLVEEDKEVAKWVIRAGLSKWVRIGLGRNRPSYGTGGHGQQELDWDSYEKMEREIALQKVPKSANVAKAKEMAQIRAER
ncbi:ribonuclease H-like domain-containing protein [Tanacetum coccineum]